MKKKSSKPSKAASRKSESPGNSTSRKPRSGPSSKDATPAQRKYVKERLAGKTKKAAALKAGYSESSADKAKEKIESKPAVQHLFTLALEEAGVTDKLLAQRIFEGLSATETKFATFEGRITDFQDVISYSERREYAELALKLIGHLIDKHELRMVRTLEEILEASNEDE